MELTLAHLMNATICQQTKKGCSMELTLAHLLNATIYQQTKKG